MVRWSGDANGEQGSRGRAGWCRRFGRDRAPHRLGAPTLRVTRFVDGEAHGNRAVRAGLDADGRSWYETNTAVSRRDSRHRGRMPITSDTGRIGGSDQVVEPELLPPPTIDLAEGRWQLGRRGRKQLKDGASLGPSSGGTSCLFL